MERQIRPATYPHFTTCFPLGLHGGFFGSFFLEPIHLDGNTTTNDDDDDNSNKLWKKGKFLSVVEQTTTTTGGRTRTWREQGKPQSSSGKGRWLKKLKQKERIEEKEQQEWLKCNNTDNRYRTTTRGQDCRRWLALPVFGSCLTVALLLLLVVRLKKKNQNRVGVDLLSQRSRDKREKSYLMAQVRR